MKKIEGTSWTETPDRQLIHPSGWCMDEHHTDCQYQFTFGKCGCSCHREK